MTFIKKIRNPLNIGFRVVLSDTFEVSENEASTEYFKNAVRLGLIEAKEEEVKPKTRRTKKAAKEEG